VSEQADRVLAALRCNPTLLHEVIAGLIGELVAGPWRRSDRDHTKRERRSPAGAGVAFVKRHPTRTINPWEARLAKLSGAGLREENFQTESEAIEWVDEQLTLSGWSLAGGT